MVQIYVTLFFITSVLTHWCHWQVIMLVTCISLWAEEAFSSNFNAWKDREAMKRRKDSQSRGEMKRRRGSCRYNKIEQWVWGCVFTVIMAALLTMLRASTFTEERKKLWACVLLHDSLRAALDSRFSSWRHTNASLSTAWCSNGTEQLSSCDASGVLGIHLVTRLSSC